MKFFFIIQGEGRGHMTQAMALHDFLNENGHFLSEVFLGRSRQREIPSFVYQKFADRIKTFHSPNFIRKKNRKGINIPLSLIYNLFLAPLFIYEIFRLALKIRRSDADMIINFYDMIGGLAHFFSFSEKKLISVAHQFYYLHPSSPDIERNTMNKRFLRWHSMLTSLKANKRIALSFQYFEDYPRRSLYIAPPLLRKELFQVKAVKADRVVVYLLNEGFLNEIVDWALSNPEIILEIYTGIKDITQSLPANILLKAPGESFLQSVASCRGLICTAGFESVCEAAYLSKPVLVWPSQGHFEQELNALDASGAGLAEYPKGLNLDTVLNFSGSIDNKTYREWVHKRDAVLQKILFDQ